MKEILKEDCSLAKASSLLTGVNKVTVLIRMGSCCGNNNNNNKTPLNLSCLTHKHLFLVYAKYIPGLMTL